MGMDPKQERVLRDGTASPADQPRDTDRESVRRQAENPPVDERPRPRRRTAAVADIRVNLQSGTPVEQLARSMGAEPIPEMGESRGRRGNGDGSEPNAENTQDVAETTTQEAAPETGEGERTLKARREHSKGDGNFPTPEPSPRLVDERPEDRTPRDLPKSRDDRSAPKGNVTVGQPDRNPLLETRDDYAPRRPRQPAPQKPKTPAGRGRSAAAPTRARARAGAAPDARKKERTSPKRSTTAARAKRPARGQQGRKAVGTKRRSSSPQVRAAAARGSRKPTTKRAARGAGPKTRSGNTRGGKR